MSAKNDKSWLFVVEYFDPMPQLKKTYLLKYYVDQHQAEMVDVTSKKMFLRKSACPPELTPVDFFIGGKILLYSRELTIVDYGDSKTRNELDKAAAKSVAIIPAEAFNSWGNIIEDVGQKLNIVGIQTVNLSPNIADEIVGVLNEESRMSTVLSRNTALLIVTTGERGVDTLKELSMLMSDKYNCSIAAAENAAQVTTLMNNTLVPCLRSTTAVLDCCTCCIIKPHAVKMRAAGSVIGQIIAEGYDVSAISTIQFDRVTAEEFLEVYKGVVPEFTDHVVQLCSGVSIAIEVRAQEDAVYSFRQLAGPWDIEIAREIRPTSIRAKCGQNRILSGIHCTDLETDGPNECEYCFHIVEPVLAGMKV